MPRNQVQSYGHSAQSWGYLLGEENPRVPGSPVATARIPARSRQGVRNNSSGHEFRDHTLVLGERFGEHAEWSFFELWFVWPGHDIPISLDERSELSPGQISSMGISSQAVHRVDCRLSQEAFAGPGRMSSLTLQVCGCHSLHCLSGTGRKARFWSSRKIPRPGDSPVHQKLLLPRFQEQFPASHFPESLPRGER